MASSIKACPAKVKWAAILLLLLLCGIALALCLRSEEPPADPELTIVHLTDLHLSSNGKVTDTPWKYKIEVMGYKLHWKCTGLSYDLLERAVTLINEKIKPDAVVVTGDIIDTGDDMDALRKCREILSKLKCPLIMAKGDHDIARKAPNKTVFTTEFGALSGVAMVKGRPFAYMPYETDAASFETLEKAAATPSPDGLRFVCLHRMLWASWGMSKLSKIYCPTLISPDVDRIMETLRKSSGRWIALCGHSHTNYESADGDVTELCTSSLCEYPHELRVVWVKGGKALSKVVTLDKGL